MAIISSAINNVVPKEKLGEIYHNTLLELADILKLSFGPNGSNACIKQDNNLPRYTKDGHSIIGAVRYNGVIEDSVREDIESITRYIVKTVGDGTTSAVLLSAYFYDTIYNSKKFDHIEPAEFARQIRSMVELIKNTIKNSAKEFTVDDAYDIAMISTNGNVEMSNLLKEVYKTMGRGVFIDVTPAVGNDTYVKYYNGMTINAGYADTCYITDASKNTSVIDKPEVYFFEHPIDTRELGVYFDSILSHNIITPVNTQKYDEIIPTVIFAPKITQDSSSIMDSLVANMAKMPINNRLPICIITDFSDPDQLADLSKMCGAKLIRKYLDPRVFEQDVKNGLAPTPDTVFDWAGTCDRVIAYSDKTTFVRPHEMFNEDGSYSNLYKSLLSYLESEIKNLTAEGDVRDIGRVKRRYNSLKSNMVEIFVGGATQTDRDAIRDLVEDAVLNIRSADTNGVGYGANLSAVDAINCIYKNITNYTSDIFKNYKFSEYTNPIIEAFVDAYDKLVSGLYSNSFADSTPDEIMNLIKSKLANNTVYNIRENVWTNNVKSSIMSDITILDAVAKILTLMITCNQFILPNPANNVYILK